MRRWVLVVAAVSALGVGCAQTKIVKRDGCWVKQTETFPKTINEEVGPCARPDPKWSNDRVARLVQECMAQADYRWQTEAVAAWSRGQALPPQQSEQTVMEACMAHASTTLVMENEALKRRVAELGAEREELKKIAQQDREHLRNAEDRMTDALGEAAKKPAPSAYATSNSTGTASTQTDQTAQTPIPGNSTTNITVPAMQMNPPIEQQTPQVQVKRPQSSSICNGTGGSGKKNGAASCTPPASKLADKEPGAKDMAPIPGPQAQ